MPSLPLHQTTLNISDYLGSPTKHRKEDELLDEVNQRIVTATDTLSWSCQKCANVNRLVKENLELCFIFVNEPFIYISYKGNVCVLTVTLLKCMKVAGLASCVCSCHQSSVLDTLCPKHLSAPGGGSSVPYWDTMWTKRLGLQWREKQ